MPRSRKRRLSHAEPPPLPRNSSLPEPSPWMLAVIPALMVAANPDWLFNTFMDQWFYWGYFLHMAQFKTWFGDAYYGDRLPWIIPGHIIHRLFDPVAAKYVFHGGLLWITSGVFYWLLRQVVGRQNAILAAILFSGNTMVLVAAGSDYVDGGGALYSLLALAFSVHASRAGSSHWWLVLSGAATAAMVFLNLFLLTLTPIAFLTHLILIAPDRPGLDWWKAQIRTLLLCAAGAVGMTILCAAVNYWLSGTIAFQKDSLRVAQSLLGARNPGAAPSTAWIWRAWWLIFPLAGLCAAAFLLYFPNPEQDRWRARLRSAFCLQTVFLWSCFLFFQITNGIWLETTFYVTFLLPCSFLALGLALSSTWAGVKSERRWLWVCLLLLLSAYCLRWREHLLMEKWSAVFTATCVVALLWKLWRPSAVSITAAWLCLLAAQAFVSMQRLRLDTPLHERHASLRRVAEGSRLISAVGGGTKVLFWFDQKDPLGGDFTALLYAHMYGYSNLDTEFPTLSADRYPDLRESKAVILTSTIPTESVLSKANRTLQGLGYEAAFLSRMRVEDSGKGYNLIFVSLKKLRAG